MLVKVGEISEESQVVSQCSTTVWLCRLDECKRRFGNPGKDMRETVVDRGLLENVQPQREKARIPPIGGEWAARMIELDQIERQVIQRRPDLVNNFSGENGDAEWRFLPDAYPICAVRQRDNCVRVTARVSSNLLSYPFDMFRRPDEFELG